jgi:hypothetical protein
MVPVLTSRVEVVGRRCDRHAGSDVVLLRSGVGATRVQADGKIGDDPHAHRWRSQPVPAYIRCPPCLLGRRKLRIGEPRQQWKAIRSLNSWHAAAMEGPSGLRSGAGQLIHEGPYRSASALFCSAR